MLPAASMAAAGKKVATPGPGIDHAFLHERRRAAGDVDLVPVDLGRLEAVGRRAGAEGRHQLAVRGNRPTWSSRRWSPPSRGRPAGRRSRCWARRC